MGKGYWREHHEMTVKEARSALWDQSRKRTVIAILVWIIALALVWLFGDHADVQSEIIVSIGFTAALVLMFPAVYTWEFVTLIPKRAAAAELALQQSNAIGVDLSAWLALDPLPLEQIAFLWCGKAPRGSVLKAESPVRLQYEKLRRDILKERLHPDWDERAKALFKLEQSYGLAGQDKWATEKTPIRIAELKRYAELLGERPAFLFPMARIEPSRPKIDISTGSGAPYELVELTGERRKSTVKIGIRNSGGMIASNCAILIEKRLPPFVHERPFPIKLGVPEFTLRPDDPEKFIEIAEYWDHTRKIRFCEPLGTTFTGPIQYFDPGPQYVITVKVRATECQRVAIFDLWVDPSNQLRLSFSGDTE